MSISLFSKFRKNIKKISFLIILIGIVSFSIYTYYIASSLTGTIGYTSDECWYVSSSRNILREIFHVQPSYVDGNGMHHYTIFFQSFYWQEVYETGLQNYLEKEYGGKIIIKYNKTPAYSIVTDKVLDRKKFLDEFKYVSIIQSGYNYPDNQNIEYYMNAEHPPLVKYIIGLSMLLFGDNPLSWKIPGIILGTLTLVILCLIVYKITNNSLLPILVIVCAFADAVFVAMSSIAMLDIYVTFFITFSMWFALKEKYLFSSISIGLAASAKLTGVFPLVALFTIFILWKIDYVKTIVYTFIIPPITWLSSNAPLILSWGFERWYRELENGLKWHITSRPEGPPTSSPWGWFYNENPFALHFNPDLAARVNPVIYFMAIILLLFVPYLYFKVNKKYAIPSLWFVFTFLGYVGVYVLGNRTLYSFYVVTLSPMAYVLTSLLILHLGEVPIFLDALKYYFQKLKNYFKK
ncbi:MAG: glycosyltransferase family 39 protein [Nitrososphaeria archaeon]